MGFEAFERALRAASFLAFVLAWVAVALGAAVGAIPRWREGGPPSALPSGWVIAGVVLQGLSLMTVVSAARYPLTPPLTALAVTLVLAPLSAAIFLWTQILALRHCSPRLITWGPYSRLRHPVYASLLGMLVSTALLAWSPWHFVAGVALYAAGSEARIRSEEEELAGRFGEQFSQWTHRVRWRYLPGLR